MASDVQSVIFDKDKWTIETAKEWLANHDFKSNKVDEKEDTYRFRQQDPSGFKRFRTISGGDGINLIVGFKEEEKKKKSSKANLLKAEIDFEAINSFMDEMNYEDNIKEHIINMLQNFTLNEINLMVQIFNDVIWQMREISLVKKDINDIELDFENINEFLNLEGVNEQLQNLIIELLSNFRISDLRIISDIISNIYWQAERKLFEDKEENLKMFRHGNSFIKSKKYSKQKGKLNILKKTADQSKHLVYGVVIEPENIDTDNEWTDEQNIENACHTFMKHFKEFGIEHEEVVRKGMELVENYIAPSNFVINGTLIKKGSWVMVHYVSDENIWNDILKGELTGYSFEGISILTDEKP
jgi:hypothetical protein